MIRQKLKMEGIKLGRYEIYTAHWKFGKYNIGETKIYMLGPIRIFVLGN